MIAVVSCKTFNQYMLQIQFKLTIIFCCQKLFLKIEWNYHSKSYEELSSKQHISKKTAAHKETRIIQTEVFILQRFNLIVYHLFFFCMNDSKHYVFNGDMYIYILIYNYIIVLTTVKYVSLVLLIFFYRLSIDEQDVMSTTDTESN